MDIPPELLRFENQCPGQANGLPGYFFTQTIQMLLATHCTIGNPNDYPKDSGKLLKNDDSFDFIIIGGGSSGSVISNRLSKVKEWKILLIEAGDTPTFESDIPGFGLSLPGRELDWKFETSKSEKSCLGMENGVCPVFQGKVLGGTSTINKMHYLRGNKIDYDEWEKLGNKGWGYDSVLKYFKKSEKLDEDFTLIKDDTYDEYLEELKNLPENDRKKQAFSKTIVGKYHSKAGMMSVNHFAYDVSLSRLKKGLYAAAEELGIPYVSDVNGKTQSGFVRAMGTIHEGNRGNLAKSFLTPVKNHQNLFTLKSATVHKVLFNNRKATSVELIQNGEIRRFSVNKEVILSAGAINSPRILLLSGIGPKKHLESLGIKVVHNLEGVGKNLQMHLSFFGLPVVIDKNKSNSTSYLQKLDAMYQFISRGTGSFGGIGVNDVIGFVQTKQNVTAPDVQFTHYLNLIRDYYTFNELLISLRIKNEIRDQFSKAYARSNVLLICPTVIKPKSRGRVELTGPDFNTPPKIISNFFEDKEDVNTLIRGIRFALRLINAKSLEEFEPELLKLEVDKCRLFEYNTDEYWECLVSHLASSMHDVAGTCKMGIQEDPFAVVDEELNVHGVEGLRVADSSIMPNIIRGSASVASAMIAEKVSDMIKEKWKLIKHTEL